MKKTLSLVAMAAFALAASAQQECVWSTQEGLEALGLSSDATELAEQSILAQGENVTFLNAFTDNAKIMDISANNVKKVVVDGEVYSLTKGTTGSSNPAGIGITAPPTGGWVYQFDVKEDGYITVFSKFSSNKSYYVFEGDATTGLLISYDFGMVVDLGEGEQIYKYTLPGGGEFNTFSMDLPDADKYSDGASLRWPEKIILGADAADVKKNGFGYITFPVYKDAETYLFCGQGTKANTNGAIFTTEKPTQISAIAPEKTNAETGEVTPAAVWAFVGEPADPDAGIAGVAADVNNNAQMFNVLGQPVNDNYKGLVIKGGKKFINR